MNSYTFKITRNNISLGFNKQTSKSKNGSTVTFFGFADRDNLTLNEIIDFLGENIAKKIFLGALNTRFQAMSKSAKGNEADFIELFSDPNLSTREKNAAYWSAKAAKAMKEKNIAFAMECMTKAQEAMARELANAQTEETDENEETTDEAED